MRAWENVTNLLVRGVLGAEHVRAVGAESESSNPCSTQPLIPVVWLRKQEEEGARGRRVGRVTGDGGHLVPQHRIRRRHHPHLRLVSCACCLLFFLDSSSSTGVVALAVGRPSPLAGVFTG
nr:unnamed protein product [Digitaria exilis]